MKVTFDLGAQSYSVEPTPSGKSYRVHAGEQVIDVQILQTEEGKLDLLIDGRRVTAYASSHNARRWVIVNRPPLPPMSLTCTAHGKRRADSEINVLIKEELQ